MSKTVIGLMDNMGEAQDVVKDLVASGIERDDIGFMASEKQATATRAAAHDGGDAASGALAGAGTGAAIGGVAGLALSLAPLAIPGIGPILAAGPIAAALTGAGIGALAGGLIGGLTKLGVPEEEAHYYAEGVRRGGILVTVAADDDREVDQAVAILKRHGAVDVEERAGEWRKQGWQGRFEQGDASTTLPVTEEELVVGKRDVERGGVRIYSRVVEQPVRESVDLTEEHVDVRRRPVDRPAFGEAFREQSFEMRERAEEPVVDKRARVVEEVTVGKTRGKKTRTIQDTVRKTDVHVERYNGPDRRMSSAPYQGADRRRAA